MKETGLYLWAASFLLSFALQYIVAFISNRYNFFIDKADVSKPQRTHQGNISRGGGLGIVIAFMSISYISDTPHSVLFFVGIFFVFLSGFLEDITKRISPLLRLILQSIGAGIAIYEMGYLLIDINIGFYIPVVIAFAFSVFCVVGMSNAMNIIDGFNGLSSGVALMVLVAILYINDNIVIANDIFILLGAIFAFFLCNIKGKIFLGDGGAYFIGCMLAILLIILTQSSEYISAWFGIAVMVYPFYEVIFSIFRKKLIFKTSPLLPDDKHLHALIYQKCFMNGLLTSLLILAYNIPFVVLAVYFVHSSIILIGISVIFICIYSMLYVYILKMS